MPLGTEARRLRRRQNSTAVQVVKADYPFYHTSSELRSELERLATTCTGARLSIESLEDNGMSLDVVHVRGRGPRPAAVSNRVLLVSGEHARELIGPESVLRFLSVLCGGDMVNSSASVSEVLSTSEFKVVVNGNPKSRALVEAGEYCLRENENNVDLNRNWDEEWDAPMTLQTANGPTPFSEPETRIIRSLAESFKPTTFLSVHSGTLGMYMPWAWSPDRVATRNQESMNNVLQAVDTGHCRCPFGGAGKEVGYPAPGTSMDWIFDKLRTPYSFAFEIWAHPDSMTGLRHRWQDKLSSGGTALLQNGQHLGHPHFREVFEAHPSDFIQVGESKLQDALVQKEPLPAVLMSRRTCFDTFNPSTEEFYERTVQNWAAAYLEMSADIAKELRLKRAVL